MARPSSNFWKDGDAEDPVANNHPTLFPGLNTRESALADYSEELAATKQPLDSDLTAIASLTTTSFGRSLLALANSAAALATLGSGTPASGKYLDGAGAWTTLPSAQTGSLVVAAWDGTGSEPVRPSATTVWWFAPTQPGGMLTGDIWTDNS